MACQIRVLVLNDGDHKEQTLYRLKKGFTLRFVLGPSLIGKSVHLFTNHPAADTDLSNYDHSEFHQLAWDSGSTHKNDTLDCRADVRLWAAGPFSYFFVFDLDNINSPCGSGFYQVEPTLTVGPDNRELPLDCIQCQTVLSKLLGPFDTWEGRLLVSAKSGYNMVHLTPIQELGISNSSYSVSNQLRLNPAFNTLGKNHTFADVAALTARLRKEWSMLMISDVVWNHTSTASQWIKENPEGAYNLANSPHLRPAYLLDCLLLEFSDEIAAGKWEGHGLPPEINCDGHLAALKSILLENILPSLKLHEFFQLNVDKLVGQFGQEIENLPGPMTEEIPAHTALNICQDPEYRRYGSSVNMSLAVLLYNRPGGVSEVDRKKTAVADFKKRLIELNNSAAETSWNDLNTAVDAILGHVTYERVAGHGPRRPVVDAKNPLLENYFFAALDHQPKGMKEVESLIFSPEAKYVMACNGWVMSDDPLKNFAEAPSKVYLRRELVVWGDNIKLRYGAKPEDSPHLWDHMTKYTQATAKMFQGIRIDNCHSTPINVAEHFLQVARQINPDLYVVAELFTGSESIDNIFVNRLGISSLIREAMSAGDAHEEGRLVYRYGGEPVGAFIQKAARPLAPTIAHAMFVDQTHDNPSPIQSRTPLDLFPSAALVAMACCATGSNRGYDEMVPQHIHVVTEKRLYPSWTMEENRQRGEVNDRCGIIAGKAALNRLHMDLGLKGYVQVFVDQVTEDVVTVTRHNPNTHQSVILVARTAFNQAAVHRKPFIAPLKVAGVIDEVILEARLLHRERRSSSASTVKGGSAMVKVFSGSSEYLTGLSEYYMGIREHIKLFASEMVDVISTQDAAVQELEFVNFPPGSVIAFRVSVKPNVRSTLGLVRQSLGNLGYMVRSMSGSDLANAKDSSLRGIVSRLSLVDINRVLFRCHEEEVDEGHGGGTYGIPGFSNMVYCGLHGVIALLGDIRLNNDLGHPLCANIRNGPWLSDYITKRLLLHPGTKDLGKWFETTFKDYNSIPDYLKPCYFDAIVSGVYEMVHAEAIAKMSTFVKSGSSLVQSLALTSCMFVGFCRSALLPPLTPEIAQPHPATFVNEQTGEKQFACPSLSAGLPHFSMGIFRNWGRDTFIALPGLMLVTGRFDEARHIILACGGCLRHGLIPNLIGSGTHARYNCRDAVWWWLNCIRLYVEWAPAGAELLKDKVLRMYPEDDDAPGSNTKVMTLEDVMQEALSRHFVGIKYRERNAGHSIDEHMTDRGFNVTAGINHSTGFVVGGNEWNCGTWMDKMGSSEKAGNRGKPATPRDGSAVELVGLCYSVVNWLDGQHKDGKYAHGGVTSGEGAKSETLKWHDWASLIQNNFEHHFWIPSAASGERLPATSNPELVNQRGIYKDSCGASQTWADYQLRPNFPIAIAVAPELFDAKHASEALDNLEKHSLGPLGMKTLDASDYNYDGFYVNSDDGLDGRRAKGFNYHQGPEWLWVVGYFLRARVVIGRKLEAGAGSNPPDTGAMDRALGTVQAVLSRHYTQLKQSQWAALPELTNKDGALCPDSCTAQAWSSATLLEVLQELDDTNRCS